MNRFIPFSYEKKEMVCKAEAQIAEASLDEVGSRLLRSLVFGLQSHSMFFEVCWVLLTLCFHPLVPEGKVQAIVEAVLGMVQVVMCGPNEPTAQPVFIKAFRVYFYIAVVDGAGQGHKGEQRHDGPVVHGQKEDDHRNDQALQ